MELSYEALELASARLRPELASPAQRAKALACLNSPRWHIQNDDELVLCIEPSEASARASRRPTRPYEVRRNSCTCKGFFTRGCYHPAAWEIVAEAQSPTTTVGGSVSASLFVHALSLVVLASAPTVSLHANSRTARLTLDVPQLVQVDLALDLDPTCRACVELSGIASHVDIVLLRDALQEFPLDRDEQLTMDVDSDSLLLCDARATTSVGLEFM